MMRFLPFLACLAFLCSEPFAAEKPNILLFVADDLGYGDLGCQGHPDFKTPNIDRLASEGIRLTQFVAAGPTCSPSRAGILTGKFPARFGILYPLQSPRNAETGQPDWLDPRALTLPRLLGDQGFSTAIRGKWHLVEEREKIMADAPLPSAYGFETWELMRGPWEPKLMPRQSFDAAVDYLKRQTRQPFFLEVTAHEPHVPYIASKEAMEGRYYITPQSVTRAIEEERAKQTSAGASPVAEPEMPKRSETPPRQDTESSDRVKELELKNRDLEITNRAKDFFLEQLKTEHRQNFERLVGMSRYVGELETQLLQLGGAPRHDRSLPNSSEEFGATSHRAEPTRNDASFPQGGVAL